MLNFSQNAWLAFMEWIVASCVFARMVGHVTKSVGAACVLVDGQG